ncbi:MAG: glycyl-radical enzyme activating protein [Pontiellaceae bacterium]|nr:glycyl-radical enzyme activating protein [Pontiellaceae bacterium]
MTAQISGIIFNIQRFSLHDGPGIRTTAFLKGCPLRCRWCHNPEGIYPEPELMHGERSETVGRTMTAEAVAEELARDQIFYEESGGGITLSGGEPLAQPEFSIDILHRCKERGLHTVLDTCGFATPDILQAVAAFTDLFLYDLKHPDSEVHERLTGVPNERIIDNLKMLCAAGNDVLVRQPIVPGLNDTLETLAQTGHLLESCGVQRLQLLEYHRLGTSKREKLSSDLPDLQIGIPTPNQMLAIQTFLGQFPFETILEQ